MSRFRNVNKKTNVGGRPRLYVTTNTISGCAQTLIAKGGERMARKYARETLADRGLLGQSTATITRETQMWSERLGGYTLGMDGKIRCLS